MRWKYKEKRPTKVTIYNRYGARYRMSRAGVICGKEEEEDQETATGTMRGGTGGQARRRRYINNGSNKAGRKRGIKKRKSKKGTLAQGRERGERIVAPSSSFPFVLSVPDLNSSQAPLQPFGLRLTVRSPLSSFSPSRPSVILSSCPSSSTSLGTLCLSFSVSLSRIATRRLSFMRGRE